MKKSTIVLVAAAIACLGLSFFSARYSVARTEQAISDIGDVSYGEECRARIDLAEEYYNALDVNLDLHSKVMNKEEFVNMKAEYVRLAIKAASVAHERKEAEGYSDEEVRTFVEEARELADTYLEADQCQMVENFTDLSELETIYSGSGDGGGSEDSTEEEESVPMC